MNRIIISTDTPAGLEMAERFLMQGYYNHVIAILVLFTVLILGYFGIKGLIKYSNKMERGEN